MLFHFVPHTIENKALMSSLPSTHALTDEETTPSVCNNNDYHVNDDEEQMVPALITCSQQSHEDGKNKSSLETQQELNVHSNTPVFSRFKISKPKKLKTITQYTVYNGKVCPLHKYDLREKNKTTSIELRNEENPVSRSEPHSSSSHTLNDIRHASMIRKDRKPHCDPSIPEEKRTELLLPKVFPSTSSMKAFLLGYI
nr:unnamed protein product [Naegleria fowleri]